MKVIILTIPHFTKILRITLIIIVKVDFPLEVSYFIIKEHLSPF